MPISNNYPFEQLSASQDCVRNAGAGTPTFQMEAQRNADLTGDALPAKPSITTAVITERKGCQIVCFRTKNPDVGVFWRALDWKVLKYFVSIWNILQTFGIFYDHLVHFVLIWYIFMFSASCTEKNLATLIYHPIP
jgi:hypothetical protein